MTASDTAPPRPYQLVHLAETDSTNAEAMRRALAGATGPLWIIADRQTAGRGRSGRTWVSEPGNLHASLLVCVACPVAKAGQLSLLAGVATIEAIGKAGPLTSGMQPRLKWPNDILVGSAKAGGILVETSARAGGLTAVIGVGLNLASAPAAPGRAATNLAAHGLTLPPREVLCFLAEAMDAWLKTWNDGAGFPLVREAWLTRAGARGEALMVHSSEGPVEGLFIGLDADGALMIADKHGRERRFTFGDVTLASDGAAPAKDKCP